MNNENHIVLCVDDDENILNSLKRLLRKEPYRLLTASSGKEGLDILGQEIANVILSDQRMPEMSGTEFLSIVKKDYPDIIRIVLTGYTDIDSITESINKGKVYKFFLKPWNDENLKLEIRHALSHYDLIQANRDLNKKLLEKNEALKEINNNLEAMVKERTKDLEIQNRALMLSRSILENIPLAVIGISAEGTIVLINHVAEGLALAMDKGSIGIGQQISEIFPCMVNQMVDSVFKTGESQILEKYLISTGHHNLVMTPLNGAFQGKGLIMTIMPCNNPLNNAGR